MSKLLSDLCKGIKPPRTRPPQVNAIVEFNNSDSESSLSEDDEENAGKQYVRKYVEEEIKMYAAFRKEDIEANVCSLNEVEETDTLIGSEIRSEVARLAIVPEVFQTYKFDTVSTTTLPIDSYKEKILNLIRVSSVVIIQGPTGCGKTTRVPQYILDECRLDCRPCKIAVTQPRRIAAINIARRVCQERNWTLGTVCGYQVGLEKQVGPDVVLTYMTTGVLLQKLINQKNLNEYTHIIVDEVHERNEDLDFLLLVVRKFLFTVSDNTKVILMSATIDANQFAYYFRTQVKSLDYPSPICQIKEEKCFPVSFFYIENLLGLGQMPEFNKHKAEVTAPILDIFTRLIDAFHGLDRLDSETNEKVIGSVLVFLPGLREIEDAEKNLKDYEVKSLREHPERIRFYIVPIHSSLPGDEQSKAFERAPFGHRKIILSTNITESSITVPDIVYVIDFCMTKNMTVDPITQFSSLQLEWASHTNCDQRAGRVGRVAPGRVYRMVPKNFYVQEMDKIPVPEMERAPLENVVLHAKKLNLGEEPKAILALAISPPNLANIQATVWHLKECQGLSQKCRGVDSMSDGDLTFFGTVMGSLPLNINLSKLIVLGHMFSLLPECIIIAAGCSIQNIFSTPYNQRLESYKKKLLWSAQSCSDLVALYSLYQVWQSMKRNKNFKNNQEEYIWCRSNLVSLKGLKEWHLLINELKVRLKHLGIEESTKRNRVLMDQKEKNSVLKVVICGAFYPHYFIRGQGQGQIDERQAVKTLSGRDPFKTVYFTGMEPNQPVQLYTKDIKKMLDTNEEVTVSMDGSSKVFVEYKCFNAPEHVIVDGNDYITTIPGRTCMPIYYAIKKRMLKFNFNLEILPSEKAWEFVTSRTQQRQDKNDEEINCFSTVDYSPLPSLNTQYMPIIVTERIDAGHFWCQNYGDETQELINNINTEINRTPLKSINMNGFSEDKLYAAKFVEDNQFYRCRVRLVMSKETVQVIFVDYGNTGEVRLKDLKELPDHRLLKIRPLAVECELSGVKPSFTKCPGWWSTEVNEKFDRETQRVILYAKVYSVVDNIVHLELYKRHPGMKADLLSVNDWLIREGYAEAAQESYRSKENHEKRLHVQTTDDSYNLDAEVVYESDKQKNYVDCGPLTANWKKYLVPITLKGPFSPLEMKIFSMIENGKGKTVDIEPSSVNTVLLDNDPQDDHARLVVAAAVHQAPSGDRLILRHTTVMPNIPGFPMLMALLFCPRMEPKMTEDGTRISSILCGLGYNETTRRAYYPAHDIVLTLDTELNAAVINSVNELRYSMNRAIEIMAEVSENEKTSELEPFQNEVKTKLFNLLYNKLKSVEPVHVPNAGVWNKFTSGEWMLLKPPDIGDNEIWSLLWFLQLKDDDSRNSSIHKNLMDLHMMAKKITPVEPIKCEVCSVILETLNEVRKHLISASHKAKVPSDIKI